MALNAQIALSIVAHESSTGDLSKTLRVTPASYAAALADGTGANQAQIAWSDSRALPEGGIDDLDLRSLSDDRGTVTFSAIKALYLKNKSASQYMTIQQGAPISNSWSWLGWSDEGVGETTLPAGAAVAMFSPDAAGMSVESSSKILRVVGGAGDQYEIVLIGEGSIT